MSRKFFVATGVQGTAEDWHAAITTGDGLASCWTSQVIADGKDLHRPARRCVRTGSV